MTQDSRRNRLDPRLLGLGVAVALALGAGCAGEEGGDHAYITPLDGQTDVALDAPLRVRASSLRIPPDYPMPDILRVVDLADGGFVSGEVYQDHDDLYFEPARGWAPGRRYVWTIDVPLGAPHGPEMHIPERLLGSSVFDTSPRMDVLAAGVDDDGNTCLVLSRVLPETYMPPIRLTANDIEIEDAVVHVLPYETWAPDVELPGLVPDVDVACVSTEASLPIDTRLRVWLGAEGPWLTYIQDSHPTDVIVALHRGAE